MVANLSRKHPLNKITLPTIRKGLAKLKKEGNKNRQLTDRSLNYYVTAVNLVLNRAVEEGWLTTPPIPPKSLWRKLRRPERPFVTEEEFNQLCESALAACPRNGRQLADLIGLLQYSGARVGVTLRLRWVDVDWANNQLIVARDGSSKGKAARRVELNPLLKAHLKDMRSRQQHPTWLSPSTQNACCRPTVIPSVNIGAGPKEFRTKGSVPANCRPGSNQVFRKFRKLLSLRRASLSKVQYYQQIAPYLYPLTELARATNWPVVFFQDN